ncbi:MAG: Uncharacterised protein [Prochlorococcus marinus str. MIT 9313]|nr:MAG: Uncharacterised protein [Prochlorococcus marinus str. MIT 9313]
MLGVVMDVIFLDLLDEVSQLLQAVAMATPLSQASMKQGTTFTRKYLL